MCTRGLAIDFKTMIGNKGLPPLPDPVDPNAAHFNGLFAQCKFVNCNQG